MDIVIELAKSHGSVGLILAYFILQEWQRRKDDRRREKLLGERLDAIVDAHDEVTRTVLIDCAKGLHAAALAMNDHSAATREIMRILERIEFGKVNKGR